MEKIVCFETVTDELDPNDGLVSLTEDDLAKRYFDRERSYSRRMTTCTEDSVEFWEERSKTMQTYVVKGKHFKYLVYDFMYMIDADTDEDGEITEIYDVGEYFVRPINEVEPPTEE